MDLIENLIQQGWLKTPRIINAFKKIKREDFLTEEIKNFAELDEALPIGFGQTISQPLVVAFMLEQLNPKAGDKILDIGSGSGWTSALLAEIVGNQGKVIATEIIPKLKELGEKNAAKHGFKTIDFICADGSRGYEKEAPFDNILASASAQELPLVWKKQLKIGGRIVTPIKNSIWVFFKKSSDEFEEIEYPGFVFVPLIIKAK
ncbi:MAG: protein-L-isoaspartate O-methyltransferase [Patescibacteria group bacterium]|nr:protein-L-isoaspartate O-methyltransferase [Patescibacteria group bacterium]MBU1876897.1 protein-L-isoaspartate O-methyltransferase [Patescibacteria group bacterium]